MRRLAVSDLTPGLILARPLSNPRGDVLLHAGVELTGRYIEALASRGVSAVFVRDPDEDAIEQEDIVSERVRAAALSNIHRIFEFAATAMADLQGASPERFMRGLNDPRRRPSAAEAVQFQVLYRTVEALLDEVLNADTLTGLNSLKSHDNYTFCHSVDVAITALFLGKKLFLPRSQLKALGAGCLLHDIGKSFVDQGLLVKPGKLTDAELGLIRQHPKLGYEYLRQRTSDILPKHVAYQHHEQQNGRGYPRGLTGANKVNRDSRELAEVGRIALLAEIAAVADVFDALASDRPYRAGLPPENVVRIMQQMRGSHLNAEVLDAFCNVLPHYPVGLDLVVTAGRYEGFHGIVLATNRRAVDRPTIRLTRDARGARLSPPLELDLAREPDTFISCVLERVPIPV